jgi:tuftelin-interacting protein 11
MIRQNAAERRAAAAREREGQAQRSKVLKADPELAKFEIHSKGIGSKLLKMMGWKPGEGLGKMRDGIAKPLEAQLRPKLAGLGAAGVEPSLAPSKSAKELDSKGAGSKSASAKEESAFKLAWKARHRKKATGQSTVKTADQLLAEQEAAGGVLGKAAAPAITILDFTGPQTRVVSSLDDLKAGRGTDDVSGGSQPFPELQHNLKLLVEIDEAEIHRLDGEVRLQQDKAVLLQQQEERLSAEVEKIDEELQRATQVRVI